MVEKENKFGLFGKFLREHRVKSNLSQLEVAKFFGYRSAQFVSNWERGLCSPPMDILPELSKMLNIPQKDVIEIVVKQTKIVLASHFSKGRKKQIRAS